VDLTIVPTSGGFAIPWLPFALLQSWPFCYWVLAVVDQFSRAVVGFAIYHGPPTSEQVCSDLDRLAAARKVSPKYTVSDKGSQFDCGHYRDWCGNRKPKIKPRFGAVGKKGSIAVVERFILSLKEECIRYIAVPFAVPALQTELNLYVFWYNHHRPHQALGGRTPFEAYHGLKPANEALRFEPRPDWPLASPCAGPQAPPRRPPGLRLDFEVSFLEGRRHLPIIEVRQAA
jgi:transposase InsO family protein